MTVDGLSIFYREAGPKDAPTLLLLHGFPSSSRMYEPLLTQLSDRYHLVTPDYPGFGHSDWPDPERFGYTFDRIASVMERFTEKLGLLRYVLYVQDYGGPVGFRIVLAHPERAAIIVQNAVAHDEGFGCSGLPVAHSGRTGPPTKRRWRKLPVSGGHEGTPRRRRPEHRTIRPRPLDGRAQVPQRQGRHASRATCSTTTGRTSPLIRSGRTGCKRRSPGYWSSGESTTPPSTSASRSATAATCQERRSTCSMRATSR